MSIATVAPKRFFVMATLVLASLAFAPSPSEGITTGYDGRIAGHVSGPDGSALQGVCVEISGVYPENPANYVRATDANGNYALDGTASGRYRITFIPWRGSAISPTEKCPGTTGNYASQCYNNQHEPNCDVVTLADSTTVTVINATLAVGGQISGRVTDAAGNPLSGVCVGVAAPQNSVLYDKQPPFAETDAAGNYTLSDLGTGSYRVGFFKTSTSTPCGPFAIFPYGGPQFYDSVVNVTEGAVTSGIDVVLASATVTPTTPAGKNSACSGRKGRALKRCRIVVRHKRALKKCGQLDKKNQRAACVKRANRAYHRALAKLRCNSLKSKSKRTACLKRARSTVVSRKIS